MATQETTRTAVAASPAVAQKKRFSLQSLGMYALLILGAFVSLFPFYYMFVQSSQPSSEVLRFPPHLWFGDAAWLNIKGLWANGFGRSLFNSAFIAIVSSVLSVFVASLAGYAFAKFRFPGRTLVFGLFLLVLMVPYHVTAVPLFRMMADITLILRMLIYIAFAGICGAGIVFMVRKLPRNPALLVGGGAAVVLLLVGLLFLNPALNTYLLSLSLPSWLSTYQAVILPALANPFGIFLMRQSMQAIPDDLLDAGRIDGAGEWRIFWTVVLPTMRPTLAALGIYSFMFQWNNFFWPLIVMRETAMETLPVRINALVGLSIIDYGQLMMGTALTTLPIMLIFLAFQRQFISGAMAGAVKG